MITLEMMPLLMFGGLILFMLVGFPVAFSLMAVGLFFGFMSIEMGFFTVSFLQAIPLRIFGVMSHVIIFPQGATHYSKHGLSLKASYPPMVTRQSVHETASRSTDNPKITQ